MKEVGNVLRLSRGKKGFLPPLPPSGSGVPSEEEKRDRKDQILLTARRVEYYCFHGLKLKDAEAKVAETMLGEARAKVIETMFSKGQTDAERLKLEDARAKVFNKKEASIHNHWKKAHRQAKPLFEVVAMVYDVVKSATGLDPDPTRKKKRYGKR